MKRGIIMLLQYSLGSHMQQFRPWWTHGKRTTMVKDFRGLVSLLVVAIKLITSSLLVIHGILKINSIPI